MNTLDTIRSWPKADLHVHLEGTVAAPLLRELAEKNDIALGTPTPLPPYPPIPAPLSPLAHRFSGDFLEFIRLYVKISSCIRSAEDIDAIAAAYLREASADGVCRAEVYVTPSTLTALGLHERALEEGLLAAERRAREQSIHLTWIFDVVRNAALEKAAETLACARRLRDRGVQVGAIGLAGLEAGHPASPFAPIFNQARSCGFRIYAHAGETAGPESMRNALGSLRPNRIGHGVRVFEDPALVIELRESQIPFEVCPWSNIALGVYEEHTHPIAKMLDAGLNVVIASDDPGIFGRTLSENYLLAHARGVALPALEALAKHSMQMG